MSEQREKGKGFFSRFLGGSQRAPAQAEKPVEETPSTAPVRTPEPQFVEAPVAAEIPEPIPPVAEPEPVPVLAPEPELEPEPALVPAAKAAETQPRGWFQKLKSGLGKTSAKLTTGITDLFSKRKLDAATLDDLEDLLIQADLGIATTGRITDAIGKGRFEKGISADEVRGILGSEVERVLTPVAKPLVLDPSRKPHVIMMVGVNGTGKTTTIGKLAQKFKAEGKSVVLAAGDTFRAAAIDQLKVWGERTGCPVVARQVGEDASGLAFDALKQAQGTGADVLLLDTAGRLQNKQVLMEELEKVIRVLKKLDSTAPHDVILVLDATTGQNALQQVEVFRDRAGVTGLVMTKLDGTARGGILVAIADKFGLPVHAIGVGEGDDDLQPFKAAEFAHAIAGT